MRYYRLYFLNSAGRIQQALDMECVDDDAAIEEASPKADGRDMELWNRDRIVHRFPGKRESAAGAAA
jgi:hypothetical protein